MVSKHTKVTISKIAESLNVSPITVSRALSNQPGVSNELRQKIIKKAKELGYKRCKKNDKVSILFLIRHRYVADHSNFSQLVEGIESSTKKKGANLAIEFVDAEKRDELVLPESLIQGKNFSGVILLGKFEDAYAANVQQVVPNMLILNGGLDLLDCNYVYYNFYRIGYRAAEYLIDNGHSRIGLIGSQRSHGKNMRYFGMLNAIQAHELEFNNEFLITREGMNAEITQLIDKENLPTAFICQSDHVAMKLIKLLHEREINVPQDVSVIGSGNSEISSITIPEITTFEVNIPVVCEVAVKTLLEQIGVEKQICRTTYIDASLIERDSVRVLSNSGRK